MLAADVAGYSRLIGHDEQNTLARLTAHHRELIDPKIATYNGRIEHPPLNLDSTPHRINPLASEIRIFRVVLPFGVTKKKNF